MTPTKPDTDELLARVGRGDDPARQLLLARHRHRLRRMVAVRLDRRLAARVDASDVVQEILIDADRRLSEFLERRPLPFYGWLRQLAWDRLVDLHRRHIRARRRSVTREERPDLELSDASVAHLARKLLDSGTSPSRRLMRDERRNQVRSALAALPVKDREILVMRHLEQLQTAEIAAVLGITEGAVKARIVRALMKLRGLLEEPP